MTCDLRDKVFYLREANKAALKAKADGNTPFGAILVGPDGEIIVNNERTTIDSPQKAGALSRCYSHWRQWYRGIKKYQPLFAQRGDNGEDVDAC